MGCKAYTDAPVAALPPLPKPCTARRLPLMCACHCRRTAADHHAIQHLLQRQADLAAARVLAPVHQLLLLWQPGCGWRAAAAFHWICACLLVPPGTHCYANVEAMHGGRDAVVCPTCYHACLDSVSRLQPWMGPVDPTSQFRAACTANPSSLPASCPPLPGPLRPRLLLPHVFPGQVLQVAGGGQLPQPSSRLFVDAALRRSHPGGRRGGQKAAARVWAWDARAGKLL